MPTTIAITSVQNKKQEIPVCYMDRTNPSTLISPVKYKLFLHWTLELEIERWLFIVCIHCVSPSVNVTTVLSIHSTNALLKIKIKTISGGKVPFLLYFCQLHVFFAMFVKVYIIIFSVGYSKKFEHVRFIVAEIRI